MSGNFEEEALTHISSYLAKGAGKQVSVQRYDDTADKYDQYTCISNYNGPTQLGKTMAQLFPTDRETIKILDVAAGTGQSGEKLREQGFTDLDAVDPSKGMLDVAKGKNIYTRLICDFVDDEHQLDIRNDTYDVVTIVGGMGENQLPSGAFKEIIRIIKPGGLIVNVTRVEHYTNCDDYRKNLTPYFRQLEADGKWKEESTTTFPGFILGKEGIVTIHRVLV